MVIGSERCISTTLRRSKRRLQARRDKRLGQIADFLHLMTRAFKCSFSTTGKFEPIPFVRLRGRGAKWRAAAYAGRKDRKNRRRGRSDVSNQSSFCPDPRRLAQPFGVGQGYANT